MRSLLAGGKELLHLLASMARLAEFGVEKALGDRAALTVLHYRYRNWGDAINPALVEFISGRTVRSLDINAHRLMPQPGDDSGEPIYAVVGSVVHHADVRTVVWGSGLQGPDVEPRQRPKRICAVRGPLTARELQKRGFDCPDVYGDPVLLLPRYYQPRASKRYRLGLVPHITDGSEDVVRRFAADPEMRIIDLRGPLWGTVRAICECEHIVSSSLHGLIVADAYGIPSAWVNVTEGVPGGAFKFRDYYASIGARIDRPVLDLTDQTAKNLCDVTTTHDIGLDLNRLLQACPFRAEGGEPT